MGWIGVDMDGTLSNDSHKKSIIPGPPIPKMVARVKAAIAADKEVRIFTARVAGGPGNFDPQEARRRISDWCKQHLGYRIAITDRKDQDMDVLWDDKARGVIRNTGDFSDVRHGVALDWDPPQGPEPLTDSGANRILPADSPIHIAHRDDNLTQEQIDGRLIEGVEALTERVARRYPAASFRGKA